VILRPFRKQLTASEGMGIAAPRIDPITSRRQSQSLNSLREGGVAVPLYVPSSTNTSGRIASTIQKAKGMCSTHTGGCTRRWGSSKMMGQARNRESESRSGCFVGFPSRRVQGRPSRRQEHLSARHSAQIVTICHRIVVSAGDHDNRVRLLEDGSDRIFVANHSLSRSSSVCVYFV